MAVKTRDVVQVKEAPRRERGLAWLWAGVLVGPFAFLSNLQANYTLTQFLCPNGRMLFLHLATALFLLMAVAGCLIAWRNWARAGRKLPDESEDKRTRDRFMGAVGLALSGLSLLIIIWQWVPNFIFYPCER